MIAAPAEKTLRRVLRISAVDGWSVAMIAGACTVISLLLGSWIGVGVGGLLTAAGVIELRGRRRLIDGEASGVNALVSAQMMILATVVGYAATSLLRYDEAALLAQLPPQHHDALARAGISMAEVRPLLKPLYVGLYFTVISVTVLFQGGLALYYHSRKPRIAPALLALRNEPPPLP